MNHAQSLEEERLKLVARLGEITKEQKYLDSLKPIHKLAESIHEALCQWNHTDGCDWFYHQWDEMNIGHSKGEYLTMARGLMDIVPNADLCLEIIKILKG